MKKEKTRNAGTMTEAGFWGWVRSALRARSVYWKPIQVCLKENRVAYKGENKRQKWAYKCNACKKLFMRKEIQIDHIIECGSLNRDSAGDFIERLFCEKDNLQILCIECHKNKTNA